MKSKEMNIALFKRLYMQQQELRSWYLELSAEDMEKYAAEYAFSQWVLDAVERNDVSDSVCKALLSSASPLKELYRQWQLRHGPVDGMVLSVMAEFAGANPALPEAV